MKVIVGLGNPDKKYLTTRHNIGFIVLDKLAEQLKLKFKPELKLQALIATGHVNGDKILLVKPLTYMNLSGVAVNKICAFYQYNYSDLLVITDDISLPVGSIRIRESGGHGGHNGLRSLIESHDDSFKRIRIGIGYDERLPLEVYVLSNFNKSEVEDVKASINQALLALEAYLNNETFANIMTNFNTKVEK